MSVPKVVKDLDLTDPALRNGVMQAEVDEGKDFAGALTAHGREKLTLLREENRHLGMERDCLKKLRPSLLRRVRSDA